MIFNPQRHLLIPANQSVSDLAQHLNHRFNTKDFFVYRHRITGNFVVARWIDSTKRVCRELTVATPPPDGGPIQWDPGFLQNAIYQEMHPHENAKEAARLLRSAELDEAREREDEALDLYKLRQAIEKQRVAVPMSRRS